MGEVRGEERKEQELVSSAEGAAPKSQPTTKKGTIEMKNMKITVTKDGKFTITGNINEDFGASTSGKTNIIASTEGPVTVGDREDGQTAKMTGTIYFKPKN